MMNLRASAIVMKNLPATAWGDALLISHAEAMRIGCELEAAADLIAELEALSVSEDKLRALFAGKVLVPVELLHAIEIDMTMECTNFDTLNQLRSIIDKENT
jgi:hypothetical protein